MAEQQFIETRFDNGEVVSSKPVDDTTTENFDVYEQPVAKDDVMVQEITSFEAENSISNENIQEGVAYVEEVSHEGPHIMSLKADYIDGLPITTTNLTTILFLLMVTAFAFYAKSVVNVMGGKLRTAIVSFVDFSYQFLIDSFDGDRAYARKYFPLIMGVFVIIFFGNLFGLVIDWLGFSIPSIHYFARPIFSDLASTLPFAVITVVYSLYISASIHGVGHTAKGYLFNWSGNGVGEKAVNVFVGWLHLVGVPSSIASLALRLFGNIFAGVVLIAVLGYLGTLATESFLGVGALLTLPFWFFELFVAFVQAAVFAMLMVATFKQSHTAH